MGFRFSLNQFLQLQPQEICSIHMWPLRDQEPMKDKKLRKKFFLVNKVLWGEEKNDRNACFGENYSW